MISQCPNCGWTHKITAKLGKTMTHKCTRCGHTWKTDTTGKKKWRRVEMNLDAILGTVTVEMDKIAWLLPPIQR
jgi:uncharacterized Zn finger protein